MVPCERTYVARGRDAYIIRRRLEREARTRMPIYNVNEEAGNRACRFRLPQVPELFPVQATEEPVHYVRLP